MKSPLDFLITKYEHDTGSSKPKLLKHARKKNNKNAILRHCRCSAAIRSRVVARLPYEFEEAEYIFVIMRFFEFIGSSNNAQPQKTCELHKRLRNDARVSPSFRLFASLTARNIGKHVNACCRIVSKNGSRSPALPYFPRVVSCQCA